MTPLLHFNKNRMCARQGCSESAFCRCLCSKHYASARRAGLFNNVLCSVAACESSASTKGFCQKHYQRWRKGSLTLSIAEKRAPEKFMISVLSTSTEECINWPYGKTHDGYGAIAKKLYGQPVAHRKVYELVHGTIDQSLIVLHICDNRACINPNHLRLGTQCDNIKDMVNKKRQRGAVGESNRHARLKEINVVSIVDLLQRGIGGKAIAAQFNVSECTIRDIAHGRTWKHITKGKLIR